MQGNFAERAKQTLVYGTALVTVGLSAHFAGIPMNKNLFSLSYILFMGGTATVLLLLFDLVVDQWQVEKPFLPLIWMGMNPMLVFVMAASGVWEQLFQWVYYQQPQNNLVDWLRTTVLVGKYGIDGGTMFYTWIKITFWVIVTGVCAYKKIFIKI